MAKAKAGDTVQVHYTGKLEDGSTFDTSENIEPIQFTIGSGQVIRGFDDAVTGMEPGESKTEKIPFAKAYGPRRADLVFDVPRTEFPDGVKPEVGMQLKGAGPDGKSIVVWVSAVAEQSVSLDANHPLAGKDLTFEIRLIKIV